MKILFIACGIVGEKPGLSGGETRFIELGKEWTRQGHEIHVLCPKGGEFLCRQFQLDARFHCVSTIKSTYRWVFFVRLLETIFCLPKELYLEKFDLVYSTSEQIYDVLPAWLLKRRWCRNRWAVAVHWLPPLPPWKRTGSNLFNSIAFCLSERVGLAIAWRKASILLPISQDTAHQLEKIQVPSERYIPVECGVAYSEARTIAAEAIQKNVDAVFMKRLQAVKGVFDLVEIWQRVVSKKPGAKLLVIGEGIDEEKMKEEVKRKGLERNIEFTGTVYDFRKKILLLASARLFILPSHEENWAIVIGEAMAAGTPVLCYDLKELRSVWQDGCWYVKKHDIQAFADKICEVLDAEKDQIRQSKRALKYVQHYDWKNIAKMELQLILSKRC